MQKPGILVLSTAILSLLAACSDEPTKTKEPAQETQKELAQAKQQQLIEQLRNAPANQMAQIVQPGKPGEESNVISAEQASNLAGNLYTEADVIFMQGMIMHHAQALDMAALVPERSEHKSLRNLAKRIEASQADEIKMMQDWLNARGKAVTDIHAHHQKGVDLMPGMLSSDEMQALKESRTNDFDKQFLKGMIKHHQGALVMVDELLDANGAQDAVMFTFATDIRADQSAEIARMGEMLAALSPDPRVGLEAGYLDAQMAQGNVKLVTSLPKPPGFYSPEMPDGIPVDEAMLDKEQQPEELKPPKPLDQMTEQEKQAFEKAQELFNTKKQNVKDARERVIDSAIMNFANTDIAFRDDTLILGNYHGFNLYDIKQPENPQLVTSVVCPGGQGDVSIVGDLLIMSVEQGRGRLDCGLQGIPQKVSDERFRGIRLFDISDRTNPRQVGAVQTCRGSHTHTVVTDPDAQGKFLIYNSGLANVRKQQEMSTCIDAPHDDDTALFSIDVIEINLNNPSESKIVNSPRIFADPKTGDIGGLWRGGDHGRGTQRSSETEACHDITVFPAAKLAAGACFGNGILMDISDPLNPVRLDEVIDPGFAFWHSATFNNQGTKVIFTDEWGGGGRPRCRANDPDTWGANAIYDIVDGQLEFRSYYKLPAPQSENENCVAHNGSLIPVPGRDVMVQSWYQGGLSIFDFTDSANPIEIAYFDRGPVNSKQLVMGGYWSSYFYKGHIYGSEIARGLDVIALQESEHLSASEIAATQLVGANIMNTQYQVKVTWPKHPVVAKAYLDQVSRTDNIPEALQQLLDELKATLSAESVNKAKLTAQTKELMTYADQINNKVTGAFMQLVNMLTDY